MAVPDATIRVLFTDVGGVLGTNGLDGGVRESVCARFELDSASAESRHRLVFDTYERGYMNFDEYLRRVFLPHVHGLTLSDLRDFIYTLSEPWPENLDFFLRVKQTNRLKLGIISNEGDGVTEYRVEHFGLRHLADFMIFSCFTHMRKPDPAIWNLGLNLAQVKPSEAIYIDDREMFAAAAAEMGFHAVHHLTIGETRSKLQALGIRAD